MLYLHETIDIRGDGAQAYMQGVLERAKHSERNGISRLVGTWQVIGSTYRWPRVVNLWEMDGWQHWAQGLGRQFDPKSADPHLRSWWKSMVQYRYGGFDRILRAAAFSPTRTVLEARGCRGWVTEQQTYQLSRQLCRIFLEELAATLAPVLTSRGIHLVGAYSVVHRPGEVVVLWVANEFSTLCSWYEQRENILQWQAWQQRLAFWGVEEEICWLVPFPGTLLWPEQGQM